MNYYKLCKKCNEHHYSNEDCNPEFKVIASIKEYILFSEKVRAKTYREAAKKALKNYNNDNDNALAKVEQDINVDVDGELKTKTYTVKSRVKITVDYLIK